MVVSRPWSARSRSVRLAGLGCPTVVQRARVREHGSGLRAQRDRGAQGMSQISAKFENKVARLLRLADVRGREKGRPGLSGCRKGWVAGVPHQVVGIELDLRTHIGFCGVVGGCKRRVRAPEGLQAHARGGGGGGGGAGSRT